MYEIRARRAVSGVEFNGMYSRLVFSKAHVDVGVQLIHEIICTVHIVRPLTGHFDAVAAMHVNMLLEVFPSSLEACPLLPRGYTGIRIPDVQLRIEPNHRLTIGAHGVVVFSQQRFSSRARCSSGLGRLFAPSPPPDSQRLRSVRCRAEPGCYLSRSLGVPSHHSQRPQPRFKMRRRHAPNSGQCRYALAGSGSRSCWSAGVFDLMVVDIHYRLLGRCDIRRFTLPSRICCQ
jgi:hypothetical protein